ncbi:insulin-like growth factor-binding protein complex acid labile subunit isoform X1 [Plodia interpunctella]|uniref:insulin-like growth factor-binding protein complex acid labile subunit isoform X1 n=2 Tax=Plodia interpunctella TaxID=58824 RepID=UPI00236894EA|nr:insulin-like growth factor-binding protein complex acid labile subunit isoform X1 [Plodia interpunctella]
MRTFKLISCKMKETWRSRSFSRKCISYLWLLGCTTILMAMGGEGAEMTCPDECLCRITFEPEDGSSLCVLCSRGGMRSVPIDYLDRNAHVIAISAPPENPNFLNIGPIFTQPVPFANLRELQIANSNVPSIGKYSFWGLQNLRLLNLTHNNLTSIDADNFRGLINLTELYLDHNNIEQMPSETFMHLPALTTLILSNNKISTLVPRLFRMLAKLNTLDLSNNPLAELNPEVFKDIQHLRYFRCRRCLLRRVNTQIYHLAPHIEELDLGENQFKYLTSDEFISLKKLKKLRLDGNQLSVIVDNMFSRNRELRVLALARNRLALLAPAALTNLTSLVHLDISHNKIDRFHLQTFAPVVESLKTINFSGNNLPLNEIAIVLQILPDIHGVGLANLSLEMIPPNFFTYNEHLVGLDISWNKLTEFPYKLLTRTKFLQHLDISHNNLQTLSEQDLQRLEAIAQISLSKNKWRCDQCSAGTMLVYMTTTVLNGTIRNLKCYSPMRLRGVSFAKMTFSRLEQCPSTHEAQMSVIAGLMLLCVAVLAAIAGALCCTRRRAAHYYTNEEKRREHEHEHPEELLGRTELGSVATIHAPYHLVSKGS